MNRDQFSGRVCVEWLDYDPRKMRVIKQIIFTDAAGLEWIAPIGAVIDGASIPKFFWRVIGSPFIGFYRRPSVFHDIYCTTKSRPAQEVHDMFLEAMIADGVEDEKANQMYQAVNSFGPRW